MDKNNGGFGDGFERAIEAFHAYITDHADELKTFTGEYKDHGSSVATMIIGKELVEELFGSVLIKMVDPYKLAQSLTTFAALAVAFYNDEDFPDLYQFFPNPDENDTGDLPSNLADQLRDLLV